MRNFIDTHNLTPKGVTLTADDIREGLTGVLSAFIAEPQFQGQTKDRLNNPEMMAAVDGAIRPALEHWLNHNISVAESIVARIVLAARAREASRAAAAGSHAQVGDLVTPDAARQALGLQQLAAATTPRSSSSKAIRPAAPPSRAATVRGRPSCRCAARC